MLSMPASAKDLAIHKLVNVCPANARRRLPTIHGQVIACDTVTGEMLFVLDGPTVTGRRTAAVTALGIRTLHSEQPDEIVLIGTGNQASNHVEALTAIFPDAQLRVKGRSKAQTDDFVTRHLAVAPRLTAIPGDAIPDAADVIVTLTTSKMPVYSEVARPGRLVVGVGAFTSDSAEISRDTVDSSALVVDDPIGAKHEAGDLIQAKVDWKVMSPLARALSGDFNPTKPVLFKSVGCAAWDLAAGRVAKRALR
jgi:1-piperideine-2-carboxylate/1-pyrroline-2-carboxylate reductase [NAD(P)H]